MGLRNQSLKQMRIIAYFYFKIICFNEAFLKDEDSERESEGSRKRSRKGAEKKEPKKRSRKKAGYIAEVGRKSRDKLRLNLWKRLIYRESRFRRL